MLELLYTFSSSTTEPPGNKQIRFNQADPSLVTTVWVINQTTDGTDANLLLSHAQPGDLLYIQDQNDHTLACGYTLTADPVDKTTYVEFAVTPLTGVTQTLLNNNQSVLLVAIAAPPPDIGSPPGATWVTLADAKANLHLPPDPAPDDADLQLKLDIAEAAILNYLKTAPPAGDLCVKGAILKLHAQFWRFRGDDVETAVQQNRAADGYFSPDITSLLYRLRDPALA